MTINCAQRLSFMVPCPECSRGTPRTVAWLAANPQMQCSAGYCRAVIPLAAPQYRVIIDKLISQAQELDALMDRALIVPNGHREGEAQ